MHVIMMSSHDATVVNDVSYDELKKTISKYGAVLSQHEMSNVYSVREACITRKSYLRKVGAMPCATIKLSSESDHSATFFLPMWHIQQEKLSFLPSMLSMAIQNSCRLVVLFDSRSDWDTVEKVQKQTADPRRPANVDMNLQDVAFDVTMEKEVHSTASNSGVVLSWIRSGEMFGCFQNASRKEAAGSSFADSGETVVDTRHDPSSLDYDPFTGYRCAFLRCESLYHDNGFKTDASWNGFNELYSLACSEIAAAYGQLNILMVDIGGGLRLSKPVPAAAAALPSCRRPPHYYWGVGNRAGLVAALDTCIAKLVHLLKSRNRVVTVRPSTAVEIVTQQEPVKAAVADTLSSANFAPSSGSDNSNEEPPTAVSSEIECLILDPFYPPAPPMPHKTTTSAARTKSKAPMSAATASLVIPQPKTVSTLPEQCAAPSTAIGEVVQLTDKLLAAVDSHAEFLEQRKAQAQERLRARMASRKTAKKEAVPAAAVDMVVATMGTSASEKSDGVEPDRAVGDTVGAVELPVSEQLQRVQEQFRSSNLHRDLCVADKAGADSLREMWTFVGAAEQMSRLDDELLEHIYVIVRSTLCELGYTSADLLPTAEQYAFIVRQLVSIASEPSGENT